MRCLCVLPTGSSEFSLLSTQCLPPQEETPWTMESRGRSGGVSIQGVMQREADCGSLVFECFEEGSHMVIVVFQGQKSSGTVIV